MSRLIELYDEYIDRFDIKDAESFDAIVERCFSKKAEKPLKVRAGITLLYEFLQKRVRNNVPKYANVVILTSQSIRRSDRQSAPELEEWLGDINFLPEGGLPDDWDYMVSIDCDGWVSLHYGDHLLGTFVAPGVINTLVAKWPGDFYCLFEPRLVSSEEAE